VLYDIFKFVKYFSVKEKIISSVTPSSFYTRVLVNWAFYFEIQHNEIEQLSNIIEIHVMTQEERNI
jgi:hypothetical protein